MLAPRSRWLITLAAPVGALALLELGLRVAGFEHRPSETPPVIWDTGDAGNPLALHRSDPWSLWSLRPGATIGNSGERINSAGFRGPELEPAVPPGTLRVVLLGESSVFGLGVPWPETCGPQLARLLDERRVPAQVVNAGVIGYSVLQGLERYRSAVRPLRPDVIVIAFGALNDFAPCQGASDVEGLDAARRLRARDDGELWSGLREHLRVVQLADWTWQRRQRAQVDELLAGGQAQLDAIGRLDWPGCRRVPIEAFEAALVELVQEARADGARVLLVSLPRLPEQEDRRPIEALYSERIEQVGERQGVTVVDARAAVRAAAAAGTDPATFFIPRNAFHLGPRGQTLLATLLADAIAAR